jgi:hypothetical protein
MKTVILTPLICIRQSATLRGVIASLVRCIPVSTQVWGCGAQTCLTFEGVCSRFAGPNRRLGYSSVSFISMWQDLTNLAIPHLCVPRIRVPPVNRCEDPTVRGSMCPSGCISLHTACGRVTVGIRQAQARDLVTSRWQGLTSLVVCGTSAKPPGAAWVLSAGEEN